MPPRVADADVKAILATAIDTTPFIHAAHILVNQYFGAAPYAPEHLLELERWWAAHLVAIRDPRRTSQTLSDTRVDFEKSQAGKGLEATSYGQQVLLLDTEGVLAGSAGSPTSVLKRASILVD